MSRKDSLRWYLDRIREAYDLAATPVPPKIHELGRQNVVPEELDDPIISQARQRLLEVSIDVKYIVDGYLKDLKKRHGRHRSNRLKDYLLNGYIERFHSMHREIIYFDVKNLKELISSYRRNGTKW